MNRVKRGEWMLKSAAAQQGAAYMRMCRCERRLPFWQELRVDEMSARTHGAAFVPVAKHLAAHHAPR